jgi:pimeloyl-ACP methyl ester carboxylesterase
MRMSPVIESHFAALGLRHVHYRKAGAGAPVLLLHQSPQSSAAMLPWFEILADRYTVIAPDTPGFGFSDPLPRQQPSIGDFAAALAEFCDALALERVAVFGVHTGALIGLTFAHDYPERVSLLIADGYARFDRDEKLGLIARYLPPFEPSFDGAHLLWLWARLREQHLYFPWYEDRAACRLGYDLPSPEQLQRDTLDLLAAGDGYRLGYRAPFLHDDPLAASRLRVRTHLLYRYEDVLASHRARLPALPVQVESEAIAGGIPALQRRVRALLDRHHDAAAAPARAVPTPVRWGRRIVPTRHGPLALRCEPHPRIGVLLLHAPCSAPYATVPGFVRERSLGTLIPELPGHGASTPWSVAALLPAAIAEALGDALAALDCGPLRLIAEGASAAIALELARLFPRRVDGIVLRDPWALDAAECAQFLTQLPPTRPDADGTHLIAAWNWVRRMALFRPWQPPTRENVRRVAAPAPWLLHQRTLEVLRLGEALPALWRALLEFDLPAALREALLPIEIETVDEDLGTRNTALDALLASARNQSRIKPEQQQ